jgi:hypothetical protein
VYGVVGLKDAPGEDGGCGWKSEVSRDPEEAAVAEVLFSVTTLRDFSKTFQSLIVLSISESDEVLSACH